MRIPMCAGSYRHPSTDVDSERCINYYPMSVGNNGLGTDGQEPGFALMQTSGLNLVSALGGSSCRFFKTFQDGHSYCVIDNTLYQLTINALTQTITSKTVLGTLDTSSGVVYGDQNPFQFLLVDGTATGYVYSFATFGSVTPGPIGGQPWQVVCGPIGGSTGNTYTLTINGTSIYSNFNVATALTMSALVTQINTLTLTTNLKAANPSGNIITLTPTGNVGIPVTIVESGTGFGPTNGLSANTPTLADTYNLTINGTSVMTNWNAAASVPLSTIATQINLQTATTNISATASNTLITLTATKPITITVTESGQGWVTGTNGLTVATDSNTLARGKFALPLPAFYTLTAADNFPGAGCVVYLDSYLFVAPTTQSAIGNSTSNAAQSNLTQFYCSDNMDATTWPLLNVATKESSADPIVTLGVSRGELWIFGSQSIELWVDTANATGIPLSPLPGGILKLGCASASSLTTLNDILIWLDPRGIISQSSISNVLRSTNTGALAVPISDDANSALFFSYLTSASSPINSNAIGMSYVDRGHMMYQITFPQANATWVCDMMTQKWHERTSVTLSTMQQGQHLAQFCTQIGNKMFVASQNNANIYCMDHAYKTDAGNPILRTYITPPMDSLNKLQGIDNINLRMGTADYYKYQGTNIYNMVMKYSNDGGHTYSNEIARIIGGAGNFNKQIDFRRLGVGHEWRFKFVQSDPIDYSIIEMSADIGEQEM